MSDVTDANCTNGSLFLSNKGQISTPTGNILQPFHYAQPSPKWTVSETHQ